MRRFLVLDPFGGVVAETDDISLVQSYSQHGLSVACIVDPKALAALRNFIDECASSVDERLARRQWRAAKLAIDPTCEFCGRGLTTSTATIDHLVPLIQGGEDIPENWALACQKCNADKDRMSATEFIARIANSRAMRAWQASRSTQLASLVAL